jgi:hypothetical protein
MNGCGIDLHSLADTGANGFLFLNRPLAKRLSKSLSTKIQRLPYQIPIKGFDGNTQHYANQFIRLHLTIDGRRIRNCPFIVLDLGNQDVIIGIKWMRRFKVRLDPQHNQFIWPNEYPPTPNLSREIKLPYFPEQRRVHGHCKHQSDANRRDRALEQEMNRHLRSRLGQIPISVLSAPLPTVSRLRHEETSKLGTANTTIPPDRQPPSRTSCRRKCTATDKSIDICQISANAFHFIMKRSGTEFFQTSLYEIDRILDEADEDDEETTALIDKLLPACHAKYRDVFSKSASDRLPPHRSYDHKIQLEGPLPNHYSPLYRQSTEELKATKQYLIDNLNKGFIVNSSSPFASPVLFVKKPNGGLRFCVDYRKLNSLTRNDPYPIPRIDELISRVSKAKLFTKIDIRQAFHRIRMDPESEEYTTFRTRYGAYKCKVLPFGLCNGPATFQRYMNDILIDYLDDFCIAYLDDILIYSEDPLQHEEQVHKVLKRLREAGLQADIRKCEFGVQRTKYLGYILTTKGLEIDPDKVEPLRNWVRPTTVTGVKSYLGFCGFYRQFIRNFGQIAKPLTMITRPSEPFVWTDACTKAFESLRSQLLALATLYHFDPKLPTKLETDSSDGVIAGVFSQQHSDQKWYPIGFYSHVLVGHESNWEIHDKELYAIIEAFRKWRPEFMSAQSRIEVYSDHRSLEYFMTTKLLTAKQVRWMEFLSDFNFQIMYTAGKNNQKADILSRREQDLAAQAAVKLDSRSRTLLGPGRLDPRINAELAQRFVESASSAPTLNTLSPLGLTSNDSELIQDLRQDNKQSFSDIREKLPPDYTVVDGLLLYKDKLCVRRNTPLCTRLIREAHSQISSAHPSGLKTYQLLAPKYHWIGMGADCKRYVKNCVVCRHAHSDQTKQQGLLHPLPIPAYPMQHLCMDFKEFPKDKHGFDCILVIIDRLGKDSVTIPCHKTIDSRGLAQLFVQWIYRFGHTPESIVSDRGPQFISSFWQELCRIIGVKIKLSTAYHKETDGQTEIMNRYIDQRLRPFVSYYQDNWSELLPLIDRVQMTLPHSSIGMAPYQLKFGLEPRTSWDWNTPKATTPIEKLNQAEALSVATRMHQAWALAKENLEKAQARMEASVNQHRRAINWTVGDKVYLSTRHLKNERPSRKLADQWTGPFKILEQVGHSYRLDLPKGSRIHDVFAPDVLMKDPNNPLPGQEPPEPPGEVIAGEQEWEVDKILAVKLTQNTLRYKVSWVGYDPDPQWYPASNFMGSPHKLRAFHDAHPVKPGPPRNLSAWIQAWENGEDNMEHLKDDAPITRSKKEQLGTGNPFNSTN